MLFHDIKQNKEILPLTELQKQMFAAVSLEKYDYFISVRISYEDALDPIIMEKVLYELMKRQQALHTIYRNTSRKGPVQVVLSEYVTPFYVDSDAPSPSIEKEPWNLTMKTSEKSLLLQYCHIVMDGWSMGIFWKELLSGYKAFINFRDPVFSTAKTLKEYQIFLNRTNRKDEIQDAFWDDNLSKRSCFLAECLRPISLTQDTELYSDTVSVTLDECISVKLRHLSSKLKVTPAVIYYASWLVLLHLFTGQDDISESIVLSGRNSLEGWENTIGMFIQTVVLSKEMPKSFDLLCYNIRDYLGNRYVDSCNAGMKCKRALDKKGMNSITDTLIAIENYPMDFSLLEDEELKIIGYEYTETPSYPFTVLVTLSELPTISIKTSLNEFRPNLTVIINSFIKILTQVCDNCNEIKDLGCVTPSDFFGRWGSINENNDNLVLADIISRSCKLNRDKQAIVCGNDSITYGDLFAQIVNVSGHLQEKGIKPGDALGVAIPRSIKQLVSVYAITMTGAIYIPFDGIPSSRANYMIKQADVKYMIGMGKNSDWSCEWLYYDEISSPGKNYNQIEQSSDNIAYILFTSGSTGIPKGCSICHKSIINRLIWNMNELKLNSDVRQMYKTPLTFDVSLVEIFALFFSGHTLYVLPENEEKMPDHILDFIEKYHITYAHFVPSMLKNLLNYSEEFGLNGKLESLRTLVCSGEILASSLVERTLCLLSSELRMVNLYGPTEAAVDVSYYNCTGTNNLFETPIGKPIDNTGLLVLNSLMKELPIGVAGELFILGRNVGLGYVNNQQLTKAYFCEIEGCAAFKTGDMAYRLNSGDIVVTGRSDRQVKYNGIRIETVEIEHHIIESGYSNDAFVFLDKKDKGVKLVACCCCKAEYENNIRKYLQSVLPKNMLPGIYFFVEEFPVSQHGKTDYNLLKKMVSDSVSVADRKEESIHLEEELSEIWNDILTTEVNYTANDHFFEVGGNSLLLIQLLIEIKKKWGIKVESSMIYENPTIGEISNIIRLNKIKTSETRNLHGSIESSQKSIYISQTSNPASTAYNMPVLAELSDTCSFEHAENAFCQVANKYEWLHKKYTIRDGELVEYIEKEPYIQTGIVLCEHETEISNLVKPFEMDHSLYRMQKVCYKGKRYIFFDFHHILCDQNVIEFLLNAWSLALSHEELVSIDLIMEYGTSDIDSDNNEHYWDEKWPDGGWLAFENLIPVNRDLEGVLARHRFEFSELVCEKINSYCKTHKCSKFQFLLSAFALFCMKAFNRNKVSIGTNTTADSFNHRNMQLQVLVLGTVMDNISFDLFVKRITHELAEGMKHGGTTVDGLYDIMFIREEDLFGKINLQSFIKSIRLLNKHTKNPLSLFYKENSDLLQFCFDYDESLFEPESIVLYSDLFEYLVNEILDNSLSGLEQYSLVTAPHVNDWNDGQQGPVLFNTVHSIQEQFIECCESHLDEAIIQKGDEHITAGQLLRKCNGCADILRGYHPTNNLVGICISNELDYIISVFGTLMAGYTFVPFDPEHPVSHIMRICEGYEISVIITDQPDIFPKSYATIAPCYRERPENICISSKYAYCIFTSGSTGLPKGCFTTQENIKNYLSWANDFYCEGEKQCFAFYGSPAVDMTITSTLLPLIYGHRLVLYPNKPKSVQDIFSNPEITIAKLTPSHLKLLKKKNIRSNLKVLIVGGEQLSSILANSILTYVGEQLSIYNEYGPAEATVGCMVYKYNPADPYASVPIGKPINNMKSYIVDVDGNICLPGVIGELVVEGKSVIGGYLYDKKNTEEHFRYTSSSWKYFTGDLARLMTSGNMIYEGRADEQFKINGFRIELAEISAVAEEMEDIDQAQAIMANGHLVLFCVPQNRETIPELDLRKRLFDVLPRHMMPSRIIMIPSLPLAKSGKIDKNVLIKMALLQNEQHNNITGIKEDILIFVRDCWENVLDFSEFGNEDGFFEVGGNSITIVSLKELLSERYDFITVADLFCYPSVRTQAEYILEKHNKKENDNSVELNTANKEVAIVGVGLRLMDVYNFSGAEELFRNGIDCGRTLLGQRKEDVKKQLKELGVPDTDFRFAKTASLDRIDLFDYEYFKIGKDEACAMDPAQRILLSAVDDAITDSGIGTSELRGMNCSVILASPTDVGFNTYLNTVYPLFRQNAPLNAVNSSIAGRIQHFYDLHGPAYMLDSACSSGLAALHNASKLIKNKECDLAIVGGVNVLDPVDYVGLKKADVLSSHYYAAPFSREADGTSRGEGCICFVLEDYEKAKFNNHYIYGKIRGSAINNDGFSSSLTAPNGLMQEAVLKQAWQDAGVTASEINILETHGTATKLGDQIELQALMNAMKNIPAGHCAISSAKAIFGHLDSASGLLGVLKSLLSIQYGLYYPTNNYREPMHNVDLISSPFFIPNEVQKIDDPTIICGISSFGLSGTNVHLVLEGDGNNKCPKHRIYHTNQKPVRCWVPDEPEQIHEEIGIRSYEKKEEKIFTYSRDDIIQSLSKKVATLYGTDMINNEIPLYRIGFDSVSVIQLRLFIQSMFHKDIDVSAQNTLEELADKICMTETVSVGGAEAKTTKPVLTDAEVEVVKESDTGSWYHLQIRSALQSFIDDYCLKTANSRAQLLKKEIYWANGRFMTGHTIELEELSYPILVASANGAQLTDIDGNKYIDFAMGFGSAFFGYNHPYIAEKVKKSLTNQIILGALMKKPFEVAERICKITGLERVSFCNSGTEAIMNLIRIARAARNRNKIVVFSGSFHGTFDPIYVEKNNWSEELTPAPRSIGTPMNYLDDIIMLSYGEEESLNYIKNHADELAAVIVEPVQSRHPDLQPKQFLHTLREITNENHVLLIFDEVITGFRSGLKGAQGFFDIKADLVSYGKVIGGGYPIGVFGGKAEFLDLIDHRGALTIYGNSGKLVSTGGTFNGHPISIAAAEAVLDMLETDGDTIYRRINQMTDYIADTLNLFFEENDVGFKVEHFCSQFFIVGEDILKLKILQYLMVYNNIYVWEGGTCFISSVHSWEQIYTFVDTVKKCVLWLKNHLPEKEEKHVVVDEKISGKDYKTLRKIIEKYMSITEIHPLPDTLRLVLTHNVANHTLHNDCASIKLCIPQKVDVELLHKAIDEIVNSHKHLRSGMSWRKLTQPVQLFYDYVTPKHNYYLFHSSINYKCIEDIIIKRKEKGFIIEEAPLVMFDSFHGADETILVITYYNSWFDGWSLDILLKELQDYILENKTVRATMNWEKYSQWKINEHEKAENYWRQKTFNLPLNDRKIGDMTEMCEYRYEINKQMIFSIEFFCNKCGISKASAYIFCLAKALNWDTVLIDFSGRNIAIDGVLDEVGMFSGLAPIETGMPEQINQEIQMINSLPLLTLGEISDCIKKPYESLVSMTHYNTIIVLNQDNSSKEFFGRILEDKSYVHVPLRFYITIDNELLITANCSVISRDEADYVFSQFEQNGIMLEKEIT